MRDHHFDPYEIQFEPPPLWLMLLALACCAFLICVLAHAVMS